MTAPARLSAYEGTRVLVTGHTGFKGRWLTLWLRELGAHVTGFSSSAHPGGDPMRVELASQREVTTYAGDIRDPATVAAVVRSCQPDIIFHLAARSLSATGREQPRETLMVNILGVTTVVEAACQLSRPVQIVAISSDKCYLPAPSAAGYHEGDRLGGHDVYSASKACMELVVEAYRHSLTLGTVVRIASTRAGNVIGGGDWSPWRLVPDIVRSASGGEPAVLRAPDGVRPWQHVLEALGGYLLLGAALLRGEPNLESGWNFGPDPSVPVTVSTLAKALADHLGGRLEFPDTPPQGTEARVLRIQSAKAADRLGWRPVWDLDTAVTRTVDWYSAYLRGISTAEELCLADIRDYQGHAARAWVS